MTKFTVKQIQGFSLVELLVAMLVGLIIISGAFSLHSTTRETQRANEAQMDLVADARFAIELISYDLHHAGMWGRTNIGETIECRSSVANCLPTANLDAVPSSVTIAGDCGAAGANVWSYDTEESIFAIDDTTPNIYSDTCIPDSERHVDNTDILVVKYADSNPRGTNLETGQLYVRSNFGGGRVFVGTQPPVLQQADTSTTTDNFLMIAHAYYISDFTDEEDDGIPSLRRAALVREPAVENQLVLSGVADMQVQFGVNLNNDRDADGNVTINAYVNAVNVSDWSEVYSVKIWLLMRSDKIQDVNTEKDFTLPGKGSVTYGGDGFRYFMVTSVIELQNLNL